MFEKFMRVLRKSKRYEMDCDGTLRVTDYFTGETITLDLSRMSEEAFEEMLYDGDEDKEDVNMNNIYTGGREYCIKNVNGIYVVKCEGKEVYYGTYSQCKKWLEKK